MQYDPRGFPKRPRRKPKPPKCKQCGREAGPLVEGKCAECMEMNV